MEGKVKITQVRSSIRQDQRKKRTLAALGLRRIGRQVVHANTPVIQGMIKVVSHLVVTEVIA